MVTGQPSDRLNEDFTPQYSEFTERLAVLEERTKKQQKALTEAAQKTSQEAKDAKDSAAKKDLVRGISAKKSHEARGPMRGQPLAAQQPGSRR